MLFCFFLEIVLSGLVSYILGFCLFDSVFSRLVVFIFYVWGEYGNFRIWRLWGMISILFKLVYRVSVVVKIVELGTNESFNLS